MEGEGEGYGHGDYKQPAPPSVHMVQFAQPSQPISVHQRSQQQPMIPVDHASQAAMFERYNGIPLGGAPAVDAPPPYQDPAFQSPRSVAAEMQVPVEDYARVHEELRRLDKEEDDLLNAQGMTPAEQQEIKEQFFHQRMNLMMRLPPEEQERYHPKRRRGHFTRSQSSKFVVEEQSHRPIFCLTTAIACVALFIATIGRNGWDIAPLDENPMVGPTTKTLNDMGAKNAYRMRHGEGWRWISPMFLHAGVIHLVMNLFVLLRLGSSMEEAFGSVRVGIVYVWSGVFGTLMSGIFIPGGISVGASGALFGLIGALFGDFIQNHQTMAEGKWCYLFQLIVSTGIGLAMGLLPMLDNFSHIGGFIGGFLLGLVFMAGVFKDRKGRRYWAPYGKVVAVAAFLVAVALFITMFGVFYDGMNGSSWCPNCVHLSCLDASWAPWSCASTRLLENCGSDTPPEECGL